MSSDATVANPPLNNRDARALLALFAHRDHGTLVVMASQSQLLRASSLPATTWQDRAIPSLERLGLVRTQAVQRSHYRAVQYTLTTLGVEAAKTTPLPQYETAPGSSNGVVSGSSRGRTSFSSSFLDLLEGTKKKEEEDTTPPHDPAGVVPGSSTGAVSELNLAQALAAIAAQQRTIDALMAKVGLLPETCSCGQVKVEKTNTKDGSKFKACPLFKACPHYSKAESPAAESARKSREAAEKTRQALQIRTRTA